MVFGVLYIYLYYQFVPLFLLIQQIHLLNYLRVLTRIFEEYAHFFMVLYLIFILPKLFFFLNNAVDIWVLNCVRLCNNCTCTLN